MNNYLFTTFPKFDLGDILLRDIYPDLDSKSFLEYITNPEVAAFISDDDLPKNLEQATSELKYWHDLFLYGRSFFWAIEDLSTKKMIGMVGYNNFSQVHKRVEVSYDLNYDFWGKGIMTRALTQINEFAESQLNATRMQATVAVNNLRSIQLLESCGFKQEGVLKKYGCLHGESLDYYMYGRVKI